MKKSISLMLLLAAMLLPTAMHAQGTAISSFPWTCDFEDADVNAVWQFSNTAPNNWIVGTAVNNTTGGDSALYISNNGTANTYDGSPALVSYAYVTLSISAAGQYAVQYDWMCEGESTYDFLRVAVSDAATTLPTSFSSWTATSVPSGFLAADGGSKLNLQGTTWQTQTAVFSVDAAGTYRLVFVWRNDGSVVHDGPAAIDNVTITELSCPQPTGLASTYIDPNQIDLSWTAGGSETSWILVVNDEDVYNPSTTSYSLTGLTPNTVYNIKLYAFCGAGDTSFATEGSFRTACVPISTLPYSNDFEDDPYYLSGTTSYEEAFPSCWTRINDATGTYNYYPYLSTSASYVIHGEKSLYWYHSNTSTYANNQYAVLPPVDPDAYSISDLTLSFYAKTTSTAAPFPQFIVGVMDDPEDVTTFVPLDTITLTTTATLYVESLADYTGSGNYIAIRSPRTSTSTVKYASLDDVYLTDAWCYPPTNVTYTATTEEITLNWDNIEGATFTVVLGEDTISGVADTTYTFSGLNPNTHLAYGVATECTSSNSFFVGGNAHTLCLPLDTLPYVQDFEDAAVGSSTSEDFVDCMERLNNGTQYFGYPYVSSTASYNHTEGGGKGLYWYGSTTTGTYGDYYIISLPAADPGTYPINTLQVRFWARATSTSYHPQFIVGVMTDPTDASTFEAVQVVDVEGTTFAEYTVAFGGYTGEGMYAAIKAVRPTSTWYAAMDDITLEPMPNCPAVTDLAATPTVASVLLTWGFQTGYEDPGQYEVVYDSIGGTTPFTMTVNGTFTAISGLEPGTTYKAYVRANCGVDGFGTWDSIEFLTGIFGCAQLDPATADTIVVGDSTLTTYYVPVNNYYNYSYTQELILASELNGATTFTGIDFDYAYTTPSTDKTNVTLYLVNTLDSTLASAFVPYNASTFVQVYQGPLNCTQGWNHFEFDTPFSYDGTSNLLVVVHDNSGDYNGSSYVFHGHSASGKVRYMQNDSSPYDITALSGSGTSGSTRANMKLYAGDCIATEVCSAPAAVVTDVTSSTVTLAWAPGAEESYWSLDYRLDGDTTWTTEASNVSVNTYTFTGLADGTSYEFRVSFVCSDAVGASYECVVSATTNCVPKPLPYVMDFDTVGMLGSGYGVMPGCWDYVLTGTSTYTTGTYLPGIYSSSSYAASGSYCLRLAGVGYFTLPEVDAQLDSLRITFNDTITSANYNGLVVGVMENGMFIPIDTVDIEIGVRNYFEVPFSD